MSEQVRKTIRLRATDLPDSTSAQPLDVVDRWTPEHALKPPEDLDRLAGLTQVARIRRSCIEAIVLNTVGRGFSIVPREGFEEDVQEGEIAELEARVDAMARKDTLLGRPSFTRQLSAVKWDEEEVGNGYLEAFSDQLHGADIAV